MAPEAFGDMQQPQGKLEHEHLAGAEGARPQDSRRGAARRRVLLSQVRAGRHAHQRRARRRQPARQGSCSLARLRAATRTCRAKPFVGAAGKLLDQLLDRIHLNREDIYIANILQVPPAPQTATRARTRSSSARHRLREQIKAIHPHRALVTMGNFSTKFILQTQTVSRLRGSVHVTGPFRDPDISPRGRHL